MTIPKRLEELLEEQQMLHTADVAGALNGAAVGLDAAAVGEAGLDLPVDVAAAGADVAAGAADAVKFAPKAWGALKGLGKKMFFWHNVNNVAQALGGGGDGGSSTGGTGSAGAYGGGGSDAPIGIKPMFTSSKHVSTTVALPNETATESGLIIPGASAAVCPKCKKQHDPNAPCPTGNTSQVGPIKLVKSIGAYGQGVGGGGAVQVRPMFSSKQAGSDMEMEILEQVKDIPRLLEMILETICRCGQPTAGKFNGMPHCIPGSGCADNIARSESNPDGDNCVSCGNPNCSGSFHGQPICAPGQGCNDHWDSENGTRKWNPLMESPEEKIADHDDWAAKTNHGDTEMPEEEEHSGTTWE